MVRVKMKTKMNLTWIACWISMWVLGSLTSAQYLPNLNELQEANVAPIKSKNVVKDIRVSCNTENITVDFQTTELRFNGLIYPKGLSKNSTCMTEYINDRSKITYVIPLQLCNTMSVDVEDGVEFFNTIVLQPHRKLVTNQGRGYHIRCRYRTEEKTLLSNFDVDGLGTTPLVATAAMPSTSMKIFRGEAVDGRVAESVKIGDPLTMVISIDNQDIYGMHITGCYVRDGLGWSDQGLINDEGCPVDWEIMGELEYSSSKTTALVHFQAHKFPYTSSVYYQCNVRLCIRHAGGCEDTPPICDAQGQNLLKKRRKRQTVELDETQGLLYDTRREDLKVKVYRGLYVSEANDLDEAFIDEDIPQGVPTYDPTTICFPQRDFAIGIAVAGLVLILIVIIAILCLLSKRRRRKDLSTTGSSIYSGPYTNTAYSHSS